jgi:superfamily I DNA/RNA helicase
VLVDETQDLNAVQIAIVLRIRKPDGRTIAIGDENQAIYGFRGADADAMDKVIAALEAQTLPLSLCYRNPKSVVRLVNETLPMIRHECLPDAPEGEVLMIRNEELHVYVQRGDMVICRTNAPLVKPAFDLIRRGIKAVIMGRSIGEELVNLINRVSSRVLTDNLDFVLTHLVEYKQSEIRRLLAQGKESTAQALEDKVDTIFALAEGCKLLPELVEKAQTIFSDDAKGVVFSSAHRAKGLEADNVFILRYDLLPHPLAKQGWQIKQEMNCKFVALTRSRSKLYFVQE